MVIFEQQVLIKCYVLVEHTAAILNGSGGQWSEAVHENVSDIQNSLTMAQRQLPSPKTQAYGLIYEGCNTDWAVCQNELGQTLPKKILKASNPLMEKKQWAFSTNVTLSSPRQNCHTSVDDHTNKVYHFPTRKIFSQLPLAETARRAIFLIHNPPVARDNPVPSIPVTGQIPYNVLHKWNTLCCLTEPLCC